MHEADPDYLPGLVATSYLPTGDRLFAAFCLPLPDVRHVLIGEGPYPREESATGVCFMDGAVRELWSEKGLSTRVNRATSLRNFIKMLLVAEGTLDVDRCGGEDMRMVAHRATAPGSNTIQTLSALQSSMIEQGFLLLNASLVFRPDVPPVRDARGWRPFLQCVLDALATRAGQSPPTLVLWGKLAELVTTLSGSGRFAQVKAEHPYNLSFIANPVMHQFFGPLHLLRERETSALNAPVK